MHRSSENRAHTICQVNETGNNTMAKGQKRITTVNSINITAEAQVLYVSTTLTNGEIAKHLSNIVGYTVRPQHVSNACKALRDAGAPRGQQVIRTASQPKAAKTTKVVEPKVEKVATFEGEVAAYNAAWERAAFRAERDVVDVVSLASIGRKNDYVVTCEYNNGKTVTEHVVHVTEGQAGTCDCKAANNNMLCKHVVAVLNSL
jgi:hypothetical protein